MRLSRAAVIAVATDVVGCQRAVNVFWVALDRNIFL